MAGSFQERVPDSQVARWSGITNDKGRLMYSFSSQVRHVRSALLAVSIGVLALSGLTACGDDGDDTAANTSASFPAEPATGAPIKIGFRLQ